MTNKDISKFLSLVLRHKPEALGIPLQEEGWADVQHLLERMQATGKPLSLGRLKEVVATNDKQRFAFNEDQTCIRASQGHSLRVDLQLPPVTPPEFLYHGTADRYVTSILQEGIRRQSRQHVHLSSNVMTAMNVGSRHGKPFVFVVKSGLMHQDGGKFYLSENNVWLTEAVAPQYVEPYPVS